MTKALFNPHATLYPTAGEKFESVRVSFNRTQSKLAHNTEHAKILYISGPMNGKKDFNHAKFNALAKHFRNIGYFVFNPAENFEGKTTELPYEEHFLEDVIQLLYCTHIYIMDDPDWENSRGAYCEYLLARRLGLIFVDLNGLYVEPPYAPETVTGAILQPDGTLQKSREVSKFSRANMLKGQPPANLIAAVNYQTPAADKDTVDVEELYYAGRLKEFVEKTDRIMTAMTGEKEPVEKQITREELIEALKNIVTWKNEPAPKKTLAEQSLDIVNNSRQADYGHPRDDFKRTVGMLNAIGFRFQTPKGEVRELKPFDFPLIMNILKLSRLVNTISDTYFHEDTVKDIHGYMNTLEMLYDND